MERRGGLTVVHEVLLCLFTATCLVRPQIREPFFFRHTKPSDQCGLSPPSLECTRGFRGRRRGFGGGRAILGIAHRRLREARRLWKKFTRPTIK